MPPAQGLGDGTPQLPLSQEDAEEEELDTEAEKAENFFTAFRE